MSYDSRVFPYIGLTENEVKMSFNLHKVIFQITTQENFSILAITFGNLRTNKNIEWEIVKKVKPFAPSDKVCKLCFQEKLSILRSAPFFNE